MIANQTLGRGFVGLGSYLLTGRDRVDPSQRVGWIEHRNLPTERLDIAIRIMAGTASLSYTKRPVFHLSISFAPGDPADAALMKRVMVRTLSDLGLGEHQAVMVAHIDTDDPHVHAMVNRVHPETGVAWKGSWSRLRVEASLRQQELEEGLQVVPGWLAPVPGHPDLRPRPRLAHGDEEFLREVQDRAGPVLERARAGSWADVEAGLAELGLSVRVNGRGMSITDGRREVKASEVGRQFSRGNLEKELGRYSDYRARVAVASATSMRDPGGASPEPATIESKARLENSNTSEAQPRFSLYEDGEVVGVWDCVGPRIFFTETRERAEEEMQRANWLAASYPNIRVVRCLRDMDGEWRDVRGLPRLQEENGRPLRRRAPPARTEPSPPLPAPAELAPATPLPTAQPEVPAQHDLPEPRWQAAAPHEAEELADAPRFTLYEDEGIFGVYDSAELQVFFSETRQGAFEEVELANELVALYPNTISMRHLREMDGAWRDARGLPRLPAPEGPIISVPWPDSIPAEADVVSGTVPDIENASPTPTVEGGTEPIHALEPSPTEPIREEVITPHHGPKAEAHDSPDRSVHERDYDGGRDAPDGVPFDDPAVAEAVRVLTALEGARVAAELARALRKERGKAEQILVVLDQQDGALERTRLDFQVTAARVYRDPAAAMAAWDAQVHRAFGNLEAAGKRVKKNPEILGPLLTDPPSSMWDSAAEMVGLSSTRMAREAVPQMLHRAVLHTPALREATKPVEWTAPDGTKVEGREKVRLVATDIVGDRRARIKAIEEIVEALGGISGAEREVQRAFARLSPAQRSQAARTIAAWGAITEAAAAAKIAEVLGKSHRAARLSRSLGEGPGGL